MTVMPHNLKRNILVAVLAALLLPATWAFADSDGEADHERARQLHDAGEIVAGQSVVVKALALHPQSRVLEIELEEKHGRLLYEVEVVNTQGNVRELYFDARSGELLKDLRHD